VCASEYPLAWYSQQLSFPQLIGHSYLLFPQLFKYTQFEKYHTLELVLLVLFAYSSYLLADGLGLSGV